MYSIFSLKADVVSDSSCYFCSLGSCLIFLRLGFRIHEMRVIIWSSLHDVWKFSVEHRYISNSWAKCPQMATPCPPDIACWWLCGVPYLGSGRKCLPVFTRLKCSRAWGVWCLSRPKPEVENLWSLECSIAVEPLVFMPCLSNRILKRIPLPTYRTLYQEFITRTTVIELGFSFVKYVVSIVHFEVLCIHLWFPVDRLSLVFLFSKLGSAKQESGQLTTSAWQSTFNY